MRNLKTTKRSLTSEMDQSVKRMLELIEEDGDSFAKKAEMYYQKRPELISIVEEFYRMYRSLAERYDHMTGESRKNVPSDFQSQGSGISDISLEFTSTFPSPDQRRKSGPRAAGFDFFLGSAGNSLDLSNKLEGYESSTLDYESESDDSSVNNYTISVNGEVQGLRMKIIELEVELRDVKEKLNNADGSFKGTKIGNADEELSVAKEKVRVLEEENARLKAGIAERDDRVEGLNTRLDEFKAKYEMVMAETDEINDKVDGLVDEVGCRDDSIDEMRRHLHQLRMEHVELAAGREGARKLVEELRWRVRQVEKEVERQRVVILEGAEEKREAIRQLCFSLEHYRNGYHRLREAFMGHKRLPIMATEFIK